TGEERQWSSTDTDDTIFGPGPFPHQGRPSGGAALRDTVDLRRRWDDPWVGARRRAATARP
ncbi:hypothetical protein, partial [Streptomyces decoyicus]|uniref:hypothetical protein n=1 Tax=Streptomyces decoyicus TaxID=249567 RepID=UPI001ADF8BAC